MFLYADERAKVKQLAEIISSGIHPIQNLSVLNKVAELTNNNDNKAIWAKHFIETGFEALEKEVQKKLNRTVFFFNLSFWEKPKKIRHQKKFDTKLRFFFLENEFFCLLFVSTEEMQERRPQEIRKKKYYKMKNTN